MTKFSSSQIPPPGNWQDFESLCNDLWSKIWRDSNTQKNGRNGQKQCGVDISGKAHDGNGGYHGVQCKGKDIYNGQILTINELESEVEKAKQFVPQLEHFILATTSLKDSVIEQRAREITECNKKKGLFSVAVFGWNDILERLEHHRDLIGIHFKWCSSQGQQVEDAFDSNGYIFDFFNDEIQLEKLQYNASLLPCWSYNVSFKKEFVDRLRSYLLKVDFHIDTVSRSGSCSEIRSAISNFNRVAVDLVKTCDLYENKYDLHANTYAYWVNVEGLDYCDRGEFIEFRKSVLRCLFYNLVKAANHVVTVRNRFAPQTSEPERYVGFVEPDSSVEYYPIYSAEELGYELPYPGLDVIEKFIREQIYIDE